MKVVALFLILLVAGCASYRPLVDLRSGQTAEGYERDLMDCQRYADQVSPATHALVGAAAGAGLAALVATVSGGRYDRGSSARMTGVMGGAAGAGHGAQDQINVIKSCMAGRGYSVLR